jgi:FtsH-binding integral membrane protein
VLAGTLLVKASTIGLWVAVMIWLSARQGITSPTGYTAFFVALTVAGMVLSSVFLGRIEAKSLTHR